uniref:Uncharacterized protein n=1 Tax=Leersia perrieri TaxID=77586 RepID=A0A0D9WB26_9ORYZ
MQLRLITAAFTTKALFQVAPNTSLTSLTKKQTERKLREREVKEACSRQGGGGDASAWLFCPEQVEITLVQKEI